MVRLIAPNGVAFDASDEAAPLLLASGYAKANDIETPAPDPQTDPDKEPETTTEPDEDKEPEAVAAPEKEPEPVEEPDVKPVQKRASRGRAAKARG